MIDVVLDLELDDWLEQQRTIARRLCERHVSNAQRQVDVVRRLYAAGDQAHAAGDDEIAERCWLAARTLSEGTRGELSA